MQATLTVKDPKCADLLKAIAATGCKCVDSTDSSLTVSGNPVQVRNAARATGVLKSAAIPEAPAAPAYGQQPAAESSAPDSVPPAAPAAPAASEGTPEASAPDADAEGPNSPDEVGTTEDVTAPDASEDEASAADTDAK